MTEESKPYRINADAARPRRRVVKSNYFNAVKDIACSLALGYESFQTNEELCDRAIEITDKLIEKVGEKL